MKDIVAIIPAREFDYNIPNKNLISFLNTNLITHKIRQLKKVTNLKDIIVASDLDEILLIAKDEGVSVFKRDKIPFEKETLSSLINLVLPSVDSEHIMWTTCCTPFINEKLMNNIIDLYFEKIQEGYDSLITVYPFKRYVIDENGALNFRKGRYHKESSKLNQLYFWINGVSIASKTSMLEWAYLWGNVPYKYILNEKESIEIKKDEDFEIAQILAKGGC